MTESFTHLYSLGDGVEGECWLGRVGNIGAIALVDFFKGLKKMYCLFVDALLDNLIDPSMIDKPLRPQINIRLHKDPTLLDEIKKAASDHNTTVSQFILDAIKSALGKPTTTTSPQFKTATKVLDSFIAEIQATTNKSQR